MTWSILEMLVTPGGSKAFITFLVIFDLLVLGPVPYARVYLQDHTTKQVVVGSSIGAAIGILAVPVRYAIFPHAVPLWI
jgi:hypothetical protein